LREALPVAEDLAQKSACTSLKISAIAAVGQLGGPEQAALLERLQLSANQTTRQAAQRALKRLEPALAIREPY